MKKKYWGCVVAAICLSLAGCAQTPEKSAVVSRAGGMLEGRIAEALPEGETRELDAPAHWKETLVRGEERINIEADIDIHVPEIGNIPIIEVEEAGFTDEMLERLCSYFSEGKTLYHPGALSKKQLTKIYERIKNKEGEYGNPYQAPRSAYLLSEFAQLIESAPENEGEPETVTPVFSEQWIWENNLVDGLYRDDIDHEKKEWFNAWIDCGKGVENNPIIFAKSKSKNYEVQKIKRTQRAQFTYEAAAILDEDLIPGDDLKDKKRMVEDEFERASEEYKQYVKMLEEAFTEPVISLEDAQKAAEAAMKELGINGLAYTASSRALIVPRNGNWGGVGTDLSEAETGYSLLYCRSIPGLKGYVRGAIMYNEGLPEVSYAPSFQQEFLLLTVGSRGICSFRWQNPARETAIAAENVKLIPFKEAAERMADHFLYVEAQADAKHGEGFMEIQRFYHVNTVELRTAYVNAFENPGNAWVIPVWLFELSNHFINDEGERITAMPMYCMISAIDGGFVNFY